MNLFSRPKKILVVPESDLTEDEAQELSDELDCTVVRSSMAVNYYTIEL